MSATLTPRERIDLKFLQHLFRTAEGRAHVLAQVADAEASGEARVFDQALGKVDDPQLARMIEKHRDDELRHAALFIECLHRTGVKETPVPEHLKLLERLDKALGGLLERDITDRKGIMEAYLLLQVIEERAISRFGIFIAAFQEIDPETARTFAAVAQDEERHLKYCQAISKRYADSEEERLATLRRFRLVEAQVFRETQFVNMDYIQSEKLLGTGLVPLFWKALSTIGRLSTALPLTPFARETAVPNAMPQTA